MMLGCLHGAAAVVMLTSTEADAVVCDRKRRGLTAHPNTAERAISVMPALQLLSDLRQTLRHIRQACRSCCTGGASSREPTSGRLGMRGTPRAPAPGAATPPRPLLRPLGGAWRPARRQNKALHC